MFRTVKIKLKGSQKSYEWFAQLLINKAYVPQVKCQDRTRLYSSSLCAFEDAVHILSRTQRPTCFFRLIPDVVGCKRES